MSNSTTGRLALVMWAAMREPMVPAPRTAILLICLDLDEGLDAGWVDGAAVLLGGMLQAPAGDIPARCEGY
jgi:hypothetical protein